MRKFVLVVAAAAAVLASPRIIAAAEPAATTLEVPAELTLRDALRLALAANPRLQVLEWEIRKAEGRTRQAGARANPELSLDFEDLGSSFSGTEATLSVGQLLELGGKRSARLGVARAEQQVMSFDNQRERLAVIAEVVTRFIEALGAERFLMLSDEEIRATEEAATTNAERVRAGAAHPVEKRRTDVELANVRLDRAILRSDLALAHSRLSSTWGEPEPRFQRLVGLLDTIPRPPDLDSLQARAEGSPALARWRAEIEVRERRLDLEHSRRVPDLTPMAGVRSLDGGADHGFVAGISLPVPLFDRNQGGIDEATAGVRQAPHAEAEARLELRRSLAESHATLRRARDKLEAIRREVLPEAVQAFEDMRTGYQRGRFSYLDLLEARHTWVRAKREELRTLLAAHLAVADIERLIGAPLEADSNRDGSLDR